MVLVLLPPDESEIALVKILIKLVRPYTMSTHTSHVSTREIECECILFRYSN